MKHAIESNEFKILVKQLSGLKITRCLRNFTVGLNEDLPLEIQQQESDGDVCLVFSNGLVVNFQAHTEEFSITLCVLDGIIKNNNFLDLSENKFWKTKIGIEINKVSFIKGDYRDNPYGIEFSMVNDEKFEIIYHENDMIILK